MPATRIREVEWVEADQFTSWLYESHRRIKYSRCEDDKINPNNKSDQRWGAGPTSQRHNQCLQSWKVPASHNTALGDKHLLDVPYQLPILCLEPPTARHPENPVGDKIMDYSGLPFKTKWNPLAQGSSRRGSRGGTCGFEMSGKLDKNFHLTGRPEIAAQQQLSDHPLQKLC